jgi:hypothetical protein
MTRAFIVRTVVACMTTLSAGAAAHAQGTSAFTYQGRLTSQSAPVSGSCTFQFTLWDSEQDGQQFGPQLEQSLPVAGGLFSTALDFGDVFNGAVRYLQVAVDCGSGSVTLPRQRVTATPYALHSRDTTALQGRVVESTPPAPNNVLRWTGSTWAPQPELGDITAVTTDGGLVGGTTNGAATLSTDPSVLQRRVGACPAGSSIRAVAADGTPTCQTDSSILGWQMVEASCTYSPESGVTSSCFASAHCPAGTRVIGGGVSTNCSAGIPFQSYPEVNAQNTWRWIGSVVKRSDTSCPSGNILIVRAICARLN